MKEQVLSIDQMQHLRELGVDTSSASIIRVSGFSCYPDFETLGESKGYTKSAIRRFGRFTLEDIIKLIKHNCEGDFVLSSSILSCWEARFLSLSRGKLEDALCRHESPLQAAYTILVWCAENGFMKGIKPKQK